jgi:hypothetical protein
VTQPVILSVQARAVGCHQQGAVAGLCQTGQRLSSVLIPPIVGGIAGRFGTSQSFLIYAAFMLPLCGLLALIIRRRQRLASGDARRLIDGALVSFIATVDGAVSGIWTKPFSTIAVARAGARPSRSQADSA